VFGIGTGEVLLILVVILLLFGGSRLPAALGGLGKGIREFKKAVKGDDEEPAPSGPAQGSPGGALAEQLRPGLGKHVRLLPDGTLEIGLPDGATLIEVDQTSAVIRGDGVSDRIPLIQVKRIIYRV
jgi:sec-independent protein translocase protein TatA